MRNKNHVRLRLGNAVSYRRQLGYRDYMVIAMADKEEHHSTTLDQKAWDDTLRRYYDDQEQIRREQVSSKAETVSHRQVREMHEAQRPTLDPATQKLWDDWFQVSFKHLISPHIQNINANHADIDKALAELAGEINKQIEISNENDKAAHKDIIELNKGMKKLRNDMVKLRKEMTSARSGNVIDLPNPIVRKQQ